MTAQHDLLFEIGIIQDIGMGGIDGQAQYRRRHEASHCSRGLECCAPVNVNTKGHLQSLLSALGAAAGRGRKLSTASFTPSTLSPTLHHCPASTCISFLPPEAI